MLTDGEKPDERSQLLKNSTSYNLLWVCCVKSVSTASICNRDSLLASQWEAGWRPWIYSLERGKHLLTAVTFIRLSDLTFPHCSSFLVIWFPLIPNSILLPAIHFPSLSVSLSFPYTCSFSLSLRVVLRALDQYGTSFAALTLQWNQGSSKIADKTGNIWWLFWFRWSIEDIVGIYKRCHIPGKHLTYPQP